MCVQFSLLAHGTNRDSSLPDIAIRPLVLPERYVVHSSATTSKTTPAFPSSSLGITGVACF